MAGKRHYALDWGLIFLDLALLFAAFWIAFGIRLFLLEPVLMPRGLLNRVYLHKDFLVLILYPLLLIESLVICSFYRGQPSPSLGKALRSILWATLLAAIFFMGLIYLFSHQNLVSRSQIVLMAFVGDCLILLRWILLRGWLRRRRNGKNGETTIQSVVVPFPVVIPIDIILMLLAFWVAHGVRQWMLEPLLIPRGLMLRSWLAQYLPLLPLYPLLMLITLSINGFFAFDPSQRAWVAVRKLALSTAEATVFLMAIIYMFSHEYLISRWQIALMAFFMSLFLFARWYVVQRLLRQFARIPVPSDAPEPGKAPFLRVNLDGLGFHCCTMQQAVEWLCQRIAGRRPAFVITPNLDHLFRFHRYPELRPFYAKADLVLADGVPIYWLSQFAGRALPEKVSGSDLFMEMCAQGAREGFRIYLLGGMPGVGERAKQLLETLFPGIQICGTDAPPYLFEKDPALWESTLNKIRQARPDILFVALGGDRQKQFIASTMDQLDDLPVRIEVGASIDFVAGAQKRAPRFVQQIGLEWFWRLALSPRRLFRRYIVDDLPFFFQLTWRVLRRKAP